jgi:hypothetical protein
MPVRERTLLSKLPMGGGGYLGGGLVLFRHLFSFGLFRLLPRGIAGQFGQ